MTSYKSGLRNARQATATGRLTPQELKAARKANRLESVRGPEKLKILQEKSLEFCSAAGSIQINADKTKTEFSGGFDEEGNGGLVCNSMGVAAKFNGFTEPFTVTIVQRVPPSIFKEAEYTVTVNIAEENATC